MMRQPSSVVEGFRCPDCMINLDNSSLLQDHWIRFHSSFEVKCRNRKLDRSIHERPAFVQFPGACCYLGTQITDELKKQVHNRSCTGDRYQVRTMLTIGQLNLDIFTMVIKVIAFPTNAYTRGHFMLPCVVLLLRAFT